MNMEYCANGDLYDFMSKYTHSAKQKNWPNKGLINHDVDLMKSMMIQIVDAVSALHNKTNCAHLDLKLENILITKDGILKLCDFGFCLYSQQLINKKLGTLAYMAPEVHEAQFSPCKPKTADIFSLGVLFFILAFGAPPFHAAQSTDSYYKLMKQRGTKEFFRYHPHSKALYKQSEIDEGLMAMLLAMLSPDPCKRVQNIEELKQFAFLKNSGITLEHGGKLLL